MNLIEATSIRNETIKLPIRMIEQVLGFEDVNDRESAEFVLELISKMDLIKVIQNGKHKEMSSEKFYNIFTNCFNPMTVTRSWWNDYHIAVNRCYTEMCNPYETVSGY